ncbi:hypothetical protein, partial [Candidatus Methanomassiliicoccus intestinalis]|uniref:hypothetical protein n=2 Tax=Candidatus Methanomassiliicoccus intestinalis TaxID=1406512 RepID=UPI0037DC6475
KLKSLSNFKTQKRKEKPKSKTKKQFFSKPKLQTQSAIRIANRFAINAFERMRGGSDCFFLCFWLFFLSWL